MHSKLNIFLCFVLFSVVIVQTNAQFSWPSLFPSQDSGSGLYSIHSPAKFPQLNDLSGWDTFQSAFGRRR
ncbi:hypothetical protein DdX_13286 [Ditylenchus destructor]|uniref:Uncharacterized protein n=1 Tax=Ditylenchus destructor TaxID=166010 RepID=A0AAD4MZ85_9BILA|nr:hypothetical protein DdX_13286 [Ditylenchus destructor]